MGREEMLNSCGFIKGEITWWHDSWLVIHSGLISSWCHFILEKSHSSLQREQCQNSIKLYLDSQKWNNCSMMDNRKSREMILLIKSWNIRQGVKHRYVLHPNNSCLLFKSVCILNDSGKIVSICQTKFKVLIPMLSANIAGHLRKTQALESNSLLPHILPFSGVFPSVWKLANSKLYNF